MGLFNSALTSDDSTHAYKEGFLPSPQDTRSAGEYGWSCTFLHYGLQKWILAGLHMTPDSQQYTAFTVGNLGFYEFTRMTFRLCNACL